MLSLLLADALVLLLLVCLVSPTAEELAHLSHLQQQAGDRGRGVIQLLLAGVFTEHVIESLAQLDELTLKKEQIHHNSQILPSYHIYIYKCVTLSVKSRLKSQNLIIR